MRDARKSARAITLLAALALLFVRALAAAATSAPVAMVSDLQGKGAIVSGAANAALTLLADAEAGARIELSAGARMVLLYLDGSGEYLFTGPALVAVRPQQAQTLKGAAAQKRSVLGGKASDLKLKPLGAVQGAMVMRSAAPDARIRL
jgi:hypothetical protein